MVGGKIPLAVVVSVGGWAGLGGAGVGYGYLRGFIWEVKAPRTYELPTFYASQPEWPKAEMIFMPNLLCCNVVCLGR
jgi:hypothetical protein